MTVRKNKKYHKMRLTQLQWDITWILQHENGGLTEPEKNFLTHLFIDKRPTDRQFELKRKIKQKVYEIIKEENSRKQRELRLDIPISGQGVTATHGGNQVAYGHLSLTSNDFSPSATDSIAQQKTTEPYDKQTFHSGDCVK